MCNPKKFKHKETKGVTKSLFSAKVARDINKVMAQLNKQETQRLMESEEENLEHRIMLINCTEDGTLLDKKREGIPIIFEILNLFDEKSDDDYGKSGEFNNIDGFMLLGLHPFLEIDDATLLAIQRSRGCKLGELSRERIAKAKNDLHHTFIVVTIGNQHF